MSRFEIKGRLYTTQLGREPAIMIRSPDGLVGVLPNRCAYKGTCLRVPPAATEGLYVTRTPFIYFESQLDRQIVLAGVSWHHFVQLGRHLPMRLYGLPGTHGIEAPAQNQVLRLLRKHYTRGLCLLRVPSRSAARAARSSRSMAAWLEF